MRIASTPVELDPVQRPDAARIDKAAREFEGVFAQMLIKSMRDASIGDSLFPGENQLYRDLYDQRLAKSMTEGNGLGLAKVIARQLGGGDADAPALDTRLAGDTAAKAIDLHEYTGIGSLPEALGAQTLDLIAGRPVSSASASTSETQSPMDGFIDQLMARARPAVDAVTGAANRVGAAVRQVPAALEQASRAAAESFAPRSPERFVASIWSHAQAAARELGVDARALVAQAALETGWGRRTIQRGDGGTAHNLFGIKATGWKGERAAATTHAVAVLVRGRRSAPSSAPTIRRPKALPTTCACSNRIRATARRWNRAATCAGLPLHCSRPATPPIRAMPTSSARSPTAPRWTAPCRRSRSSRVPAAQPRSH